MKMYSSREAAKKIGITLGMLQRHIARGTFPVPPVKTIGTIPMRLWTVADIARAKKIRRTLKTGRKRRA